MIILWQCNIYFLSNDIWWLKKMYCSTTVGFIVLFECLTKLIQIINHIYSLISHWKLFRADHFKVTCFIFCTPPNDRTHYPFSPLLSPSISLPFFPLSWKSFYLLIVSIFFTCRIVVSPCTCIIDESKKKKLQLLNKFSQNENFFKVRRKE